MTKDNDTRLADLRKKHEEFLAEMKRRGYDIDKLPPLTADEQDQLDTVIHNANRSRQFNWNEDK
jgi:hypothetical protein